MNPPLPRPEPAKLYRGTRSGSLQDLILRGCSPGLSSPFQARPDLLPSHIPSETVLVGRTPELPRGPLFIFRKIHLYGKTKKSTHGHQTTKPFCTHFFKSLPTDQIDQGESDGGGPDLVRGLWPAQEAIKVGCRVASS
jgi:hypothetical protein